MKKTLKEFLQKNHACKDEFDFAKDLTLEEFLKTCERGDWILWLFAKMNRESLQELTLAKGHCANTVRELMKDERSTKAVDVTIAFGEGRATREELDAAAAWAAAADADAAAWAAAADADAAAWAAAWAAWAAWAAHAGVAAGVADAAAFAAAHAGAFSAAGAAGSAAGAAARKQNQKQTADICRKYLPLEIWNQNLI